MIITYISVATLLTGVAGAVWYSTRDTRLIRIKRKQVYSFKEAFNLTRLAVMTFRQDGKPYHFMVDSGSNVTYVDSNSGIKVGKTIAYNDFISGTGTGQYALCPVSLQLEDKEYSINAGVTDMKGSFDAVKQNFGVQLSGLIGTDFMKKYNYCIDFKECVIYERK